jgi:hypothetical protein
MGVGLVFVAAETAAAAAAANCGITFPSGYLILNFFTTSGSTSLAFKLIML